MSIGERWRALPRFERFVWWVVGVCLLLGALTWPVVRTVSPRVAVDAASLKEGQAFWSAGGWNWSSFMYGGSDPWGNHWLRRHEQTTTGHGRFDWPSSLSHPYSPGPDGVDDLGKNDDLEVPRDPVTLRNYMIGYSREGFFILAALLVWWLRAPFSRAPRGGVLKEIGRVLVAASLPTALIILGIYLATEPVSGKWTSFEAGGETQRPWVEAVNGTFEPLGGRLVIPVRGAIFGSAAALCLIGAVGFRLRRARQAAAAAEVEPPPRDPSLGPYAFVEPTFGHYVSGSLMHVLAFTVRVLPLSLAYLLADALTPVLVLYTRLHERRVAKKGRGFVRNLRIVFRDELTPEQTKTMLWGYARHMTHTFVDFFRLPKMTPENYTERVDVTELQVLTDLQAEGKGVICVGGHMGALELSGAIPALSGLPCVCVSRPADNPIIRRLLRRIRNTTGQRIIHKFGALWPLRKALKRGEMVGLPADENEQHSPTFVPFLGTIAATNAASAHLQKHSGATIAVVSCHRVGRGRYRYHVWKVIRHEEGRDVESVTAEICAEISRAILAYPTQWLWGSRRFQTRPQGEVLGPDGLPPVA